MLTGPDLVKSIPLSSSTSVLGIAGYYTDYDGLQHVIVATKDGNTYEVHWSQYEFPEVVSLTNLGGSLVDIAGFFTTDDDFHHTVGITSDGTLHELYFSLNEPPNQNNLPYHIDNFDPGKGAAGFYSPEDNLRHVVIVDKGGNPVDIIWNGQIAPQGTRITNTPAASQIASISGFRATDDNSRHIILASRDTGQVYDVDDPYGIAGQGTVHERTSFNEPVKNVTAFFSPDNNYRHIVVLTQANVLKDHAYDTQGNTTGILLTTSALSDVADITSFYSAEDGLRHVIFATPEGSLYEIKYTSQG